MTYEGYVETIRLPSVDPVAAAFPGNRDLDTNHGSRGGIGSASRTTSTSYDEFTKGNPDV